MIAAFAGIAFYLFKMNQLNKLEKMSSKDAIDYVTRDDSTVKISIAIIKDGEITYQVYGKNSEILNNTKYDYEIGSISKTFAALLLSKAAEENKIDMNASYSNFGISIVGLILEKVYNKDYTSRLNNFIENDLNLGNTKTAVGKGNLNGYWDWKPGDGYIPAGVIISNIEDMAEYLNLYLRGDQSYVNNTYKSLKRINANNSFY